MSAHAHHVTSLEDPGPLQAPGLQKAAFILVGVGVLGLVLALALGGMDRFWSSILQGMLIPLYLGVAGLFFISVHNIGGAHWLTPYRRLIEGMTAGIPIGLVCTVLIGAIGGLWMYDFVYATHPMGSKESFHDSLFHVKGGSKTSWMVWWRFFFWTTGIVAAWWFMRNKLVGNSLKQDSEGGVMQKKNFRLSLIYIFIFGLGLTFFVWDMLLSLHLNWFSTMWGVYCFASALQTFLCTLVLLSMWLRKGPLKHYLPKHVVHDLGTWMVAWSCFCAYIGFSQYMLIYYANLDEETYWYILRTQNGYGLQYAIEALIRWPLPFLGLMSQKVRTNPKWLVTIAIIVLVGNWLDWSWIIMPAFSPNEYRCPFVWEMLVGAGFVGGWLLLALRFWGKHGIVAKKDPYMLSTVNGEHLH